MMSFSLLVKLNFSTLSPLDRCKWKIYEEELRIIKKFPVVHSCWLFSENWVIRSCRNYWI